METTDKPSDKPSDQPPVCCGSLMQYAGMFSGGHYLPDGTRQVKDVRKFQCAVCGKENQVESVQSVEG